MTDKKMPTEEELISQAYKTIDKLIEQWHTDGTFSMKLQDSKFSILISTRNHLLETQYSNFELHLKIIDSNLKEQKLNIWFESAKDAIETGKKLLLWGCISSYGVQDHMHPLRILN